MPRYKVNVYRTGYSSREIEVEAENEKEAGEKAEDVAGNYEFSENSSEYESDWVDEIKEQP